MKFKLKKIAGDASFRQFYRLTVGIKTSIIVVSQKDRFKNLVLYSFINKFLKKKGIFTPQLLNEFYNKGIIEIEDFGDMSFYQYIKKTKNKYNAYKKIIKLLLKIQRIKPKKLINVYKNYKINLNIYNRNNLHKETDLFLKWYLVGVIGKANTKKYASSLRFELEKIYKKIYFKNIYFVHRDFHVSNIMSVGNKIGLIDTQDAIIGNPLYDLVSLIDDVRIKTSLSLKKKIFNFYLKKAPKIYRSKKNKFIDDFNILSIQRNLKILGVFYRLYKRDKKEKYLKFIPYTWKLIEMRLESPIFKNLKILLNKTVNKKLRKKELLK